MEAELLLEQARDPASPESHDGQKSSTFITFARGVGREENLHPSAAHYLDIMMMGKLASWEFVISHSAPGTTITPPKKKSWSCF